MRKPTVPPPNPENFWPFPISIKQVICKKPMVAVVVSRISLGNALVEVDYDLDDGNGLRMLYDWLRLDETKTMLQSVGGVPQLSFTLRKVDGSTAFLQITALANAKIGERPYYIGVENREPFIQCLKCRKKSFHPGDIKNRYCANCGVFHES